MEGLTSSAPSSYGGEGVGGYSVLNPRVTLHLEIVVIECSIHS